MSQLSDSDPSTLLPHQADFINRFFHPPLSKGYLLESEVGLGAKFMAAHLIAEFVKRNSRGRVLILVPAALQTQMDSYLNQMGTQSIVVDRYRYRELEEVSELEGIWPNGSVVIMSMDFAKKSDVLSSLMAVEWDLLVVPEAHLLRGLRAQAIQQIISAAASMRVVLITSSKIKQMPDVGIELLERVGWERAKMVDQVGNHLFSSPAAFDIINFHEFPEEEHLRKTLEQLIDFSNLSINGSALAGLEFLRQSSPSALEECLRLLKGQLVYGESEEFIEVEDLEQLETNDPSTEGEEFESLPETRILLPVSIEPSYAAKLLERVNICLEELDKLSNDAKLTALLERLHVLQCAEAAVFPVCIVAMCRSTISYIQTQLQERQFQTSLIHDSMPFDERQACVATFRKFGGVLLATPSVMEGMSFPDINILYFYDIPHSAAVLDQIYGRFLRFGRKAPLHVSVFSPNGYGFADILMRLAKKLNALSFPAEIFDDLNLSQFDSLTSEAITLGPEMLE